MTAIIGINAAILAMVAAWNSDFGNAILFMAGAGFCGYELAFGRALHGGPL